MCLIAPLPLPITDPVFIFALVMMIILVAPILFEHLKIPGVVGLILAGLIVGPNVSGLLARDDTIELLGTVGLLYIMFVAGLDVNLAQFARFRNNSMIFGALTFLVPQVTGTLLAVYVLGFAWTPAVLLASLFASHTLLAYPIAARLGIGRSAAVVTAVGGTIITDTAALMVLVVIARSVSGALDAAFWIRLAVALVLFTILVFWALPRVGRWFFRRQRAESASEFVFVLAALFISALFSEFAGMEPIIGAFMAGLALNRLIPEQGVLMNRIQFVGNALFIPFFLISVGMLVDLRIFTAGRDAWILSGFMVSTVIATKFAAAEAGRRIFGYSRDEGLVLFGLSIAQAAATLAAVVIGFELGIFGESIVSGAVFMILVTCLLSPWVIERFGRRMALVQEQKLPRFQEALQRILVPLANPVTAESLMDVALMIRHPDHDEPIYPLVVVPESTDVEAQVFASEKVLARAVARAAAAEVPVYPVTRVDMNVADGIVRAIRERRISQVVIGWNGEVSRSERIFGSVVDQMLTATRELVMVCKMDRPLNTFKRIMVAVPPVADREHGFAAAVRVVVSLADQLGTELFVVSTLTSRTSLELVASQTASSLRMRFEEFTPSEDLLERLEALASPDDLIAVLSAREGTLSWRPLLDRLPRLIAERLPTTDFVIVYPPEKRADDVVGSLPEVDQALSDLLDARHVLLEAHEHDGEVMIREMLRTHFEGREDVVETLLVRLIAGTIDSGPEISKGVAFLHAHTGEISHPTLYVGISPNGVQFPRSSGTIHIVLVILNPLDRMSPAYLRLLASIARAIGDETTVESLRHASSAENACAVLSGSLRQLA